MRADYAITTEWGITKDNNRHGARLIWRTPFKFRDHESARYR
jgi:hypothetical protein